MVRSCLAVLVALLFSSAARGGSSDSLRFEISEEERADPAKPRFCSAVALRFIDGTDTVRWRRPLPARMRARVGECEDVEIVEYRRHPQKYELRPMVVHFTDHLVFVGNAGGLLGFERASGRIVLDYAPPKAEDSLFFDRVRYSVGDSCKGDLRHGGSLLAHCGEDLLYFNGSVAALFGLRPVALRQLGVYRRGMSSGGEHGTYLVQIPLGDKTLKLEVQVFLR